MRDTDLYPRNEDGVPLAVFTSRVRPDEGAEVVIFDFVLISSKRALAAMIREGLGGSLDAEIPPSLLSILSLHPVFVQFAPALGFDLGECVLDMRVDLIIVRGQFQGAWWDEGQKVPVGLCLLDGFHGESVRGMVMKRWSNAGVDRDRIERDEDSKLKERGEKRGRPSALSCLKTH